MPESKDRAIGILTTLRTGIFIEGFAAKYRCIRLVYYESFYDIHRAIGREKQLKGWRRSKKIALIEKVNPRWEDLAEKWGSEMRFSGQPLS